MKQLNITVRQANDCVGVETLWEWRLCGSGDCVGVSLCESGDCVAVSLCGSGHCVGVEPMWGCLCVGVRTVWE